MLVSFKMAFQSQAGTTPPSQKHKEKNREDMENDSEGGRESRCYSWDIQQRLKKPPTQDGCYLRYLLPIVTAVSPELLAWGVLPS